MFDQFKAMGAIAALMKDKERLRAMGEQFKARLEAIEAEGEAGGGAVRVRVSGTMEVRGVDIAPSLAASFGADGATTAMAEGLIGEAMNKALALARQRVQAEAQKAAEEMGLPDMPGLTNLLG
ncbi:MAG: YbaB/EbfC family nucleoid-associated protein [Phycisphaerales bacterium]